MLRCQTMKCTMTVEDQHRTVGDNTFEDRDTRATPHRQGRQVRHHTGQGLHQQPAVMARFERSINVGAAVATTVAAVTKVSATAVTLTAATTVTRADPGVVTNGVVTNGTNRRLVGFVTPV